MTNKNINVLALLKYMALDYSNLLEPIDKDIIKLIFSKSVTQDQLEEFLSGWDIEMESCYERIILMSYFQEAHPDLVFSEYFGPRLAGVNNFFKFKGIKILSGFSKVGRSLNKSDIPILLFKSGIMKFLRPNLNRPFGDVDFLVPPEKYNESIEAALKLGFNYKVGKKGKKVLAAHSRDLLTDDGLAVDIHSYSIKDIENENISYSAENAKLVSEFDRNMFTRATKIKAFGVDAFLPSREDLLFLVFTNLFFNAVFPDEIGCNKLLLAIFDIDFIINYENKRENSFWNKNKPFNWNLFIENAKQTHTLYQIQVVVYLINSLAPSILPKDLESKISPALKNYNFKERLIKKVEKRIFDIMNTELISKRKKQKSIKFKNINSMLTYLFLEVKYCIYRFLRGKRSLRDMFLKGKLKDIYNE